MKRIILYTLSAMTLLVGSCKSFLDEESYDFISKSNFYKTEGDAIAGLNGAYNIMQIQQLYGRTIWILMDLTGDLMKVGAPQTNRPELYNQTFTGTNGEIANWWNNLYVMINRANDVIAYVPQINMDEAKRNNIVGNARFLRALGYFDLVRSFGAIPLSLKPTEAGGDMRMPRSSITEIYASIIEDLKYAESNCLAADKIPSSDRGRVSAEAASALLAKVYLTKATTETSENSDYQLALEACNRVIGKYALIPFADVFDVDKKANNREEIFAVQFGLPPNTGNITPRMHLPRNVAPGDGNEAFFVENVFAESYAAEDLRKDLTLAAVPGSSNYYYKKFYDPQRQGNNARNNQVLLRYADVLLMQSEALNQLNAADPKKLEGINAVRQRAGLSALMLSEVSGKEAFVDALVRERGWEFAAEGIRRYDLLRLNRMKEQQLAIHEIQLDDKYLLFPIPQTELDLNPNLLPQNPGF